ncbi:MULTISPECIES: hypothetical protein [unclassified Streptomyces]|uniref:hypothetical protein n=1 Tax=unclassified Streptomyces TaxID=2593676 RepID=UPI0036503F5E
MTAWQYFAGAGLVAALCPLHGHVAVAGDGNGRGARVDVCVPGGTVRPPAGRPRPAEPPVARPPAPSPVTPAPRVTVSPSGRPTVHHPGVAPGLPALPAPASPAGPPGPGAPAPGDDAKPAPAPPAAGEQPEPASAEAAAPPAPRAAAAFASAFRMRPYHSAALERRGPDGLGTMTLMAVVTTPAVLAAAALRPRSKSRG